MRAISVGQLKPGLVLGRPLFDERGHVLLNRGVTLTEPYIRSLSSKKFSFVYIRDETDFDVEPEEDLSAETRARALAALQDSYAAIEKEVQKLKTESVQAMAEACSSEAMRTLMSEKGPLSRIGDVVRAIMDEILDQNSLAGLATIRSADAQLHEHSVGVCIVGLMIGKTLDLPDRTLRQLAAGCLLHDLGMVFVDSHASEVQRVRQHTLLGYELLRNASNGDMMAPHVALEHHEHQDGTGLPRGTKGSNALERDRSQAPPIPSLIGEIAAVANMYDSLLNGRHGMDPAPPDVTLDTIQKAAGPILNRTVVSAFTRCVPVYPVGAEIIVRSERYRNFSGLVQEVNPGSFDRPVIALTRDNRQTIIKPIFLNLKEETDVTVQCRGLAGADL